MAIRFLSRLEGTRVHRDRRYRRDPARHLQANEEMIKERESIRFHSHPDERQDRGEAESSRDRSPLVRPTKVSRSGCCSLRMEAEGILSVLTACRRGVERNVGEGDLRIASSFPLKPFPKQKRELNGSRFTANHGVEGSGIRLVMEAPVTFRRPGFPADREARSMRRLPVRDRRRTISQESFFGAGSSSLGKYTRGAPAG